MHLKLKHWIIFAGIAFTLLLASRNNIFFGSSNKTIASDRSQSSIPSTRPRYRVDIEPSQSNSKPTNAALIEIKPTQASSKINQNKTDGEPRFRVELSKFGFSESEIEIAVKHFNNETNTNEPAVDTISRELELGAEKLSFLSRAYSLASLYGDGFDINEIRTCLTARFPRRSACADTLLQEFLSKLDEELVEGQFAYTEKVFEIQKHFEDESMKECGLSQEYVDYQFKFVFVKCEEKTLNETSK